MNETTAIQLQQVKGIATRVRDSGVLSLNDTEQALVAHALDRLADDLAEASLPDRFRRKQKGRDE